MSFLHPQLLWLLLLPAALLLAAVSPRARSAAAAPHPRIPRARLLHLSLVIGHWSFTPRPVAACAALGILVLALARPQGATLSAPAVTQARDVLVAVDVSRSMLADDVSPNRLTRAQFLVRSLADELKGERLGLLPFAGTAFLQCPLSADYEIFHTFLDELGPNMIPAGGSDFTALLTAVDEAFGPDDRTAPDAPPPADRYLVILSDGEAQDDTWKPLAQKLADRGVRVLALGLGTAAGAMIPDGKGGLAKDERGAAILSRLDASTLQELVRVTDGAYRDASSWVDLPALLRDTVARGHATRTTTDTAPRREELFAWFLAPALALLALALIREFPVTPRPRPLPPPKIPTRHAASLALLLTLYATAGMDHSTFAAEAPSEPPPDPLVELVGRLAAAPDLPPADLARLAALTAEQGEKARTDQKSPLPEGALHDALAAIDQGRAAAPSAADWSALRARVEALLAPPPEPPKSDQSKQDKDSSKNDPKEDGKNDPKNDDKTDSPNESSDSPPKSQDDKQSSPQKDQNASDQSQTPQSSSDSSPSSENQASGTPGADSGKPSGPPAGKPLGDLAQKPDDKTPEPGDDASPAPAPPPDQPPPEPTQRAGGVSASGQAEKGEANGSVAQIDPALAIPQQRLERVRDSDAPARLYQLLQEAENPPDATRRAPGSPTRDW